jgi:hypothetical protein
MLEFAVVEWDTPAAPVKHTITIQLPRHVDGGTEHDIVLI